jgi:hypothetical protein
MSGAWGYRGEGPCCKENGPSCKENGKCRVQDFENLVGYFSRKASDLIFLFTKSLFHLKNRELCVQCAERDGVMLYTV